MTRTHLSLRDSIDTILSYLPCTCNIPCLSRQPPSPPLSPQQGELETLLGDESWRDDDDAVSLQLRAQPSLESSSYTPRRGMRLFSRPSVPTSRSPSPDDGGEPPTLQYDDDPVDLDTRTLHQLPELARRYEPTLTLDDVAREEAEQAERERETENSERRDIPSPPVVSEEDEFGGFNQAGTGNEQLATGQTRSAMLSDTPLISSEDTEDEDVAEISFGLEAEEGPADSEGEA